MKVLWFSRHNMTETQFADLQRIYGDDVHVRQVSATASSYKDVVIAGNDCDVLAVVLPPAILSDLVNPRNNSKPVIRAVASRIPTGREVLNPATGTLEKEYAFEHVAWERVLRIEIVTERL